MEERRMPNQYFETTKFIVQVGRFNLSSSPSWWSSSFVCFRASSWIKSVQPRSQNVARPTPIGKSRCTCVGMFFFTDNYSLSFVRNMMFAQRVHRSLTMRRNEDGWLSFSIVQLELQQSDEGLREQATGSLSILVVPWWTWKRQKKTANCKRFSRGLYLREWVPSSLSPTC